MFRFKNIISSLFLIMIVVILSVKLVVFFKPLYYFSIDYLDIHKTSGMDKEEIKDNYDYIINYLTSHKEKQFNLPTLHSSEYGKIHFKEVKDIFNALDKILLLSLFVFFVLMINHHKSKDYLFITYSAKALLVAPLILVMLFLVDFNSAFTIFHKLIFNNDYWQFNPSTDPVINILPQQFFFYCGTSIMFTIIIFSILLQLFYSKLIKKKFEYIQIKRQN
ncbi:integral membrane protein TIGR01906 [Alkalithermobacter thermoalcaliphilus JW-YL-7 = DSM 7308]|uniref:Integral membrane protein TIGR01906 n=1 Tax=Alkalithermobacter thermoalcaliphilus JW-YL-7 = DSM 7308 TaxID=1121328 RepID=A0A150FQJ0_CLOPD|nr:integral membrane protein TIGR01906 [[Clostridium] paradoxum JW-YL-7 = DSM 7308]SHK78482.1 integral membrane protein TIGR01906 [[Clostridium] paradoxum JW-YL-7 = DSM 7308]